MDTLKQTAVTALLNLPEFTDIDDMIAVLRCLQFHRELADLPPSFLEVAKEYIGSLEGPADLSTNPTYMKDYGQSFPFRNH